MKVTLTKSEKDLIEWAIDPTRDMWCTEDGAYGRGEETIYDETDLPRFDGMVLISDHTPDDIMDDIEYRITVQAMDMADNAGGIFPDGTADSERMQALREIRAIKSLSRKMGWEL